MRCLIIPIYQRLCSPYLATISLLHRISIPIFISRLPLCAFKFLTPSPPFLLSGITISHFTNWEVLFSLYTSQSSSEPYPIFSSYWLGKSKESEHAVNEYDPSPREMCSLFRLQISYQFPHLFSIFSNTFLPWVPKEAHPGNWREALNWQPKADPTFVNQALP